MLDRLHKKLTSIFFQPFLKQYLKKERFYTFENFKLKIYPGVFHPAYFFSTQFFATFITHLNLKNKLVCEVGGGSGLLSVIALSKGATVVSFDINVLAVKGLEENLSFNFPQTKNFEIYKSDLFDDIPRNTFDVFLINPPYFFSEPTSESSFAWNCGKNGEYFKKLFSQLPAYSNESSEIYMSLADNCDVKRISDLAAAHNYLLILAAEKKIKWEKNFIFKITKN